MEYDADYDGVYDGIYDAGGGDAGPAGASAAYWLGEAGKEEEIC